MEVIVDMPVKEGEKTPPYAKIKMSTKKKSSVTLPANPMRLARKESFGNDSGFLTSDEDKHKVMPSWHREPEWRKEIKDLWSSDESDIEGSAAQRRRASTLSAGMSPKPSPLEVTFHKQGDMGKVSHLQAQGSPANTPEIPRRTVSSRILDKPRTFSVPTKGFEKQL